VDITPDSRPAARKSGRIWKSWEKGATIMMLAFFFRFQLPEIGSRFSLEA
jgi:hypothetical protein